METVLLSMGANISKNLSLDKFLHKMSGKSTAGQTYERFPKQS